MQRGGLLGLGALIVFSVMLADVEMHPAGTQVGLNGLSGLLKTSLSAGLGGAKING